MAISSTYCTHRDLKDIYPNLDEFDTKTAIYGWEQGLNNYLDSTVDLYTTHNTGLISQLYFDGAKVNKIDYRTSAQSTLNGNMGSNDTTFDVVSGAGFTANDIIKIGNEYMRIVSVVENTITVSTPGTNRGLFNTNAQVHSNGANVYIIILSAEVGDSTSAGHDDLSFVYESDQYIW